MRKTHSGIAVRAAVLACVGIVGAAQTAAQSKSLSIVWAEWAPADALAQLGKLYEAESEVRVTVQQIPWTQYKDKVDIELSQKGTKWDLIVGDSQWLGEGAVRGHYVELTDWVNDPANFDKRAVSPAALSLFCEYPKGSGRYYAVPCETDAMGFCYRKDLFESAAEKSAFKQKYGRELTVPDTWDEFKQVAEFFTRPAQRLYGTALLTGRGYDQLTMGFQQVMWSYGGGYGNEKFEVKGMLNSAETAAALEFFKSLLAYAPRGGANFDYSDCMDAFNNGLVAMSMNYFAFYPGVLEGRMGRNAGFFRMPGRRGADGKVNRVISLGGQGLSVISYVSDEQKAAARAFLKWFSAEKQQVKWAELGGFTANDKVLASETFRKATPYNAEFAASLPYLRDFWSVPEYGQLLLETQKWWGRYLDASGPTPTAQECLDALAGEHERILRAAGHLK